MFLLTTTVYIRHVFNVYERNRQRIWKSRKVKVHDYWKRKITIFYFNITRLNITNCLIDCVCNKFNYSCHSIAELINCNDDPNA